MIEFDIIEIGCDNIGPYVRYKLFPPNDYFVYTANIKDLDTKFKQKYINQEP